MQGGEVQTNNATQPPHALERRIPVERDDEMLVKDCQAGDEEAFRLLVQRYQKKLFSVAFGMVHHAEDALDIIQDAFLKAHRNLPNFQGNSSFYTWIYRITVNLCIDFLRKETKHQALDYDDTLHHETHQPENAPIGGSAPASPSDALKNKELGQQIWSAIQRLSENHRSVILLREIEGMSYEEIAQTLQCSKGTVMSRLHHARSHLRKFLEDYLDGDYKGDPLEALSLKENAESLH